MEKYLFSVLVALHDLHPNSGRVSAAVFGQLQYGNEPQLQSIEP